jgi:hypothetical protein
MNNQKIKEICDDNGLYYYHIDRLSVALMEVPHAIYGAWDRRQFSFNLNEKYYVAVMWQVDEYTPKGLVKTDLVLDNIYLKVFGKTLYDIIPTYADINKHTEKYIKSYLKKRKDIVYSTIRRLKYKKAKERLDKMKEDFK